ncbi:MAG: hypothetical protein HY726_19670, partial [Candidatus Rokubacteria bacterium]|nr:hypothetical protein [Candidatus Rokubacteria bacterium]
TRAFPFPSWRFPVGLIRLNLRGREPQGIVEPGREAEQLLGDLARRLLAVRDPGTGERLIEWVKRREELFSGPRAGDFPDLFYGMRPPYCANNRLHFRGPLLYDEAEPRFCHSYEGILLAAGRGVRPGMVAKARIADIAPTLLYLSGLPVDPYLDGRVLADLFQDEMLESRPPEVRDTGYGEEVQRQAQVVREADNQYIRKQLERMGYL